MNETRQKRTYNEDSPTLTVTKAQYDALIDRFPGWMASVWPKFRKSWTAQAIVVQGCAGSGLADKLCSL